MNTNEIRILKGMYERTGGAFGNFFNPYLFLQGSNLTKKEFQIFLERLEKDGYIQSYQGSNIIFTKEGLDWISGEISGENQRKKIQFLKAIYEETGGRDLLLDAYVLQLGQHVGLKKDQILPTIQSFITEGYLRANQIGGTANISVSQMGKQLIEPLIDVQKKDTQKYEIFISHVHENEEIAKKLKEFLKEIFGDKIEVFISGDPETIQAGQDFFTTITDGIKKCNCMIILCSPLALTRYYVYFEAGGAALLDRMIVPICFDGQSPGSLPAPLDHLRKQAIDCAESSEKFERHFQIIFQDIASKINIPVPTVSIISSEFYKMIARPWTFDSLKKYLFDIGLDQLEINIDEFSTDTYSKICQNITRLDSDFLRGMRQMGFLNKDNTVTETGYLFVKSIVGEYIQFKI